MVNMSYRILSLGNAWAANTVNTGIFRHHAIFTHKQFQFSAFYENSQTIKLVQRNLSTSEVIFSEINGVFNIKDAHNIISLGIDRKEYLHIVYDHHISVLRYRKSKLPLDIHEWTDESGMSGKFENNITYPTFMIPANHPLLMLYRDGRWNAGSARIKEYDEETDTWIDRENAILSGRNNSPWTSNAYWNHPAIAQNGDLHLSFTWRVDYSNEEKRINNINIDYAYSQDAGKSWLTSKNRPLRLPITQVNSETIFAISPDSNLMNQCSMALDSKNHPHIVFYSDGPRGIPQYQHLWFTGKVWKHRYISQRKKTFILSGAGTLDVPISRPEIVIDKNDIAYVIYRGDLTCNKLVSQRLLPPLYLPNHDDYIVLWNQSVDSSEPVIDRIRWQRDNILTMYIQKTKQTDNEGFIGESYNDCYLVDWNLPSLYNNTLLDNDS